MFMRQQFDDLDIFSEEHERAIFKADFEYLGFTFKHVCV